MTAGSGRTATTATETTTGATTTGRTAIGANPIGATSARKIQAHPDPRAQPRPARRSRAADKAVADRAKGRVISTAPTADSKVSRARGRKAAKAGRAASASNAPQRQPAREEQVLPSFITAPVRPAASAPETSAEPGEPSEAPKEAGVAASDAAAPAPRAKTRQASPGCRAGIRCRRGRAGAERRDDACRGEVSSIVPKSALGARQLAAPERPPWKIQDRRKSLCATCGGVKCR